MKRVFAFISTSMSDVDYQVTLFEKESDAKAYFRAVVEEHFDAPFDELVNSSAEDFDEEDEELREFFVSECYAEELEDLDFAWYRKWIVCEMEVRSDSDFSFTPTYYSL